MLNGHFATAQSEERLFQITPELFTTQKIEEKVARMIDVVCIDADHPEQVFQGFRSGVSMQWDDQFLLVYYEHDL